MDSLTPKEEDIVLEAGREKNFERKSEIGDLKICDVCGKEFEEEDLDLVHKANGKNVWACRECEEELETYREEEEEEDEKE